MPVATVIFGSTYNFFRSDAASSVRNPVRSRADLQLSRESESAWPFSQTPSPHGRAVPPEQTRALPESFVNPLSSNRIDDATSLERTSSRLQSLPNSSCDHDRHARDVGSAAMWCAKNRHGLLGIGGPRPCLLRDLLAVFNLWRHASAASDWAAENQLGKTRRAGYVRAVLRYDEAGVPANYDCSSLKRVDARGLTEFGGKSRTSSAMAWCELRTFPQ